MQYLKSYSSFRRQEDSANSGMKHLRIDTYLKLSQVFLDISFAVAFVPNVVLLLDFSHCLSLSIMSMFYVMHVIQLWLTREVIAGFEQAIQAYAVHVLSLTYQKVPRSVLAEVYALFFLYLSLPLFYVERSVKFLVLSHHFIKSL